MQKRRNSIQKALSGALALGVMAIMLSVGIFTFSTPAKAASAPGLSVTVQTDRITMRLIPMTIQNPKSIKWCLETQCETTPTAMLGGVSPYFWELPTYGLRGTRIVKVTTYNAANQLVETFTQSVNLDPAEAPGLKVTVKTDRVSIRLIPLAVQAPKTIKWCLEKQCVTTAVAGKVLPYSMELPTNGMTGRRIVSVFTYDASGKLVERFTQEVQLISVVRPGK
jgi:hypothetical protein